MNSAGNNKTEQPLFDNVIYSEQIYEDKKSEHVSSIFKESINQLNDPIIDLKEPNTIDVKSFVYGDSYNIKHPLNYPVPDIIFDSKKTDKKIIISQALNLFKKRLDIFIFKLKSYLYFDKINTKIKNLSMTFDYSYPINLKLLAFRWSVVSLLMFVIFSSYIIFMPPNLRPHIKDKYEIYSSKPLVLGASDFEFYSKDSRSQRINEIFKQYNCPLEGLGEIFVMEADKNNIPWWVVAAISFQESSCGKQTPEIAGVESFNAWGWAVWGDNTHMFSNWVRGIETVSKYLNETFYSKGITEPCVIMKTYTPPSKGSWCEGVKHFGEEIVNYKTP